ncbi:tuftelin-interacting protein 11-like isoform X2 [Acanthaster planci]|uniref:Tuftelin-interacting protein 11-like isoform X2 n=1 Tax=Acanthaster planci TaxID=133434 RepID=A0A8B7ZD50_ACAPL|nr:tuftelin-interacting protein 11-like isoform X2 [Acanthaster planci]
MDSDKEEVEDFEITDYDLLNEFNVDRPRRRMTKAQAIYGVWANSDDEPEERQGFGSSGRRGQGDLNFISTEVTGGEQNDENKDGKADISYQLPLRAEGSSKGQSSKVMTNAQKKHAELMKSDKQFGNWQKHTTGFGEKLLLQMGYIPGKGLGKANQGIVRPVQATKHKGKGAVGSNATPQYVGRRGGQEPEAADSEEEEDAQFREELARWKKGGEAAKKKTKYVYRTVEEVKKSGHLKKRKKADPAASGVKVIDMTGPEQRVMSGYSHLGKQHDKPSERLEVEGPEGKKSAFEMPELEHNLQLLVEMAEQQIIQHDRQLHHEEDMVVNLQHEQGKLRAVLNQEERQISQLEKIMGIVEQCEARSKPGCPDPLSLDDCEEIFKTLQSDYREEYRAFELSQLAAVIVLPLIKEELRSWNALRDSNKHVDLFKRWKGLLDMDDSRFLLPNGKTMTVYERLAWDIWMPQFRRAISNWNMRECDPIIELLENWLPLLPQWLLNNILDQLIYPRLQETVDEWNPVADVVPIHAWLHPWLPLMGDKLEPLYIPIRQKLAKALTNWHPSDTSAKTILMPWRRVFSRGTLEAFLVRNIVPKLAVCLQEFVINPYDQHLEPYRWVVDWEELLPTPTLASLFEKHFLPKWLQVLCSWLGNNPDYEEVSEWYLGWKGLLPERIREEPAVKAYLKDALDVMNQAVSGAHPVRDADNMAYVSSLRRQREATSSSRWEPEPMARQSSAPTITVPTNFRDLVEKKASENNIVFLPTNRRHEGKNVYVLGPLNIYIERSVVYVHQGHVWTPMGLQTAIELAQNMA